MSSALAPNSDIVRRGRHFAFVPMLSKKELRSGANSDSCLRSGRRVGDDGAAELRSAAAVLRVYPRRDDPGGPPVETDQCFRDTFWPICMLILQRHRPALDRSRVIIRMLLVGYCYGIRHERRLCQEVTLHLAYRWFCKLDLDDKVPHHSTFSVNWLGRFRESGILRHIFERVVATSMAAASSRARGSRWMRA